MATSRANRPPPSRAGAADRARDELPHLLRSTAEIQTAATEAEALDRIAGAVADAGWTSVVACLFKQWQVVCMAQCGLTAEELAYIEANPPSPTQRAAMYGPEFAPYRVSRSYFLTADQVAARQDGRPFISSPRPVRPGDTWQADDVFYVPLCDRHGAVMGTLSLDGPADGQRPTESTIRHLEFFADLAARTIENLRLLVRHRQAKLRLAERESWFRAIFDSVPECVKLLDADGNLLDMNRAGLGMIEAESVEPLRGRPIQSMIAEPYRAEAAESLEAVFRGEARELRFELISLMGTHRWMESTQVPLHDARGRICAALCVSRDISERQRAEAERARRSTRERLMYRELDHRVRNNLHSLISIIDITKRSASSVGDFARALTGRVQNMAEVHGLLSSRKWSPVALHELAGEIVPVEASTRVVVQGEPVLIPPYQATSLALVLHELITNSRKYGAIGCEGGHVNLYWRVDPADGDGHRLLLRWQETGGPIIEAKPVPGAGTSLIEGLVRFDLRGEARLSYPPAGASHELTVRLGPPGEARAPRRGGAAGDAAVTGASAAAVTIGPS